MPGRLHRVKHENQVLKTASNLIEYEISLKDIQEHNPGHLVAFFQAIGLAKGAQLAALQGCFNIVPSEDISGQPFNNRDVRAYCDVLSRTPLGLVYFLHPESQSLHMLAFAVASRVETLEDQKTGNVGVHCESADLVAFLAPDLAEAEKLFKRAGLGLKAFDDCARRVSQQFNLKSEDWD